MEGIAAKKMIAMVLMMMALLATQLRAADEFAADTHPADIDGLQGIGSCAKACAIECVPLLYPTKVAACMGICIIRCKFHPPTAVLNCTGGCANSIVNAYYPTDAEKVDGVVSSYYKTCKHNN